MSNSYFLKGKKKVRVIFFIVFAIVLTLFSSCGKNEEETEVQFFRKIARERLDNGWVYTFVYGDWKDEDADDSDIIKYMFYGVNIRYRYDDDYVETIVHEPESPEGGLRVIEYPSCLIAGHGLEAEARDMALINETILEKSKSVDELLALTPGDYEFESIDEEMFLRLMKTALTGEPHKENPDMTYWEIPPWALYSEQAYLSGYKFQIGYMMGTGCVDELFIDVLYPTGDGFRDYAQLSDLVDDGRATEEQKQVFEKLQGIAEEIKENESFIWGAEDYRDEQIGDIDFSRLYSFLKNIHENKADGYLCDPVIETVTVGGTKEP